MNDTTRLGLGMTAIGAGIVHLGVVAGAPLLIAVPSLLLGLAELAWGVAAFVRDRPPLTRTAMLAVLAGPAFWCLVLITGEPIPMLPALISTVLDLAIAVVLAISLRLAASPGRSPGRWTRRPAVQLPLLFVSALAVGALVTPALAGSTAGDYAVPHGEYGHGAHGSP